MVHWCSSHKKRSDHGLVGVSRATHTNGCRWFRCDHLRLSGTRTQCNRIIIVLLHNTLAVVTIINIMMSCKSRATSCERSSSKVLNDAAGGKKNNEIRKKEIRKNNHSSLCLLYATTSVCVRADVPDWKWKSLLCNRHLSSHYQATNDKQTR